MNSEHTESNDLKDIQTEVISVTAKVDEYLKLTESFSKLELPPEDNIQKEQEETKECSSNKNHDNSKQNSKQKS